jgi:tetratricopeptide (TPR) repeat protein
VEIAKRYGAKVLHLPWNHDFSEARNFCISHATCDWILSLDADERIERKDLPKIRKIIRELRDIDGVYMTIWNQGNSPASVSAHYLIKLFRRKSEIRYQRRIHEVVTVSGATYVSNIRVIHLGYYLGKERMEEKYLRDLDILLECHRNEPNDPVINFYTARTYYHLQRYDEALVYAEKAEALMELPPKNLSFYVCILMTKANILIAMRKFDEAESVCQKGLKWMECHLDLIYLLATTYWSMKRSTEAVIYYRKYLLIRDHVMKEPSKGFLSMTIGSLGKAGEVYNRLADIYLKEGNYLGAIREMKQALKFNPYSAIYYYNLGAIYLSRRQLAKAKHNFQQALRHEPSLQKARDALDKLEPGFMLPQKNNWEEDYVRIT